MPYIHQVKTDAPAWLKPIRYPNQDWGRLPCNTTMIRPCALQASGTVIRVLHRLGALNTIPAELQAEADRSLSKTLKQMT